jgi:alpha-L-rhamnosidase
MWERWDALRPDGSVAGANTMVSFNHYAYGAVGDFLYRRIAGIEATEAGYRKFNIAPKLGGGLTYAKAELNTPHGKITSSWRLDKDKFTLTVDIPPSTQCTVTMPDNTTHVAEPGNHVFECVVK